MRQGNMTALYKILPDNAYFFKTLSNQCTLDDKVLSVIIDISKYSINLS